MDGIEGKSWVKRDCPRVQTVCKAAGICALSKLTSKGALETFGLSLQKMTQAWALRNMFPI